jgi:hypothetical protein
LQDLSRQCPKSGGICRKDCKKLTEGCSPVQTPETDEEDLSISFLELALSPKSLKMNLELGSVWYRVHTKSEIFQIFDMIGDASYMLVGGNTARGNDFNEKVFPIGHA